MSRKLDTLMVCGIEILAEQRTPLVEALLRVIEQLQATIRRQQLRMEQLEDEIARLKGLPELPKRPPQPSALNDPSGPPSESETKKSKKPEGKRPGSEKRSKTQDLVIHNTEIVPLENLPEGAKFLGYEDYFVQDLKIEPYNTRYRRCRYQFPDGSIHTAPLPKNVTAHFGPTVQQYALYQHFHNHVTQPLLYEELQEIGVDLSTGQVNRMLTEGHELFHHEKDSLLPAAREVSDYLHTDDTTAMHQGKSGHTLHIGNDFFASFFTTETKSRVNFLKILLTPHEGYLFNSDALDYLEYFGVSQKLRTRLQPDTGKQYGDDAAWEKQLKSWEIASADDRRLVTEAALWAHLLDRKLYFNLVFISDDAAQFKVLGFLHALCWVHRERHIARLIPITPGEQNAYQKARDDIWNFYQRLKAYRKAPTPQWRGRLDNDFDELFGTKTGWSEVDVEFEKILKQKSQLLLVLEHPEIPLQNNLSENDIRQYVKKRKISAGTRSEAGRRCRDTFLSLKTTCRKLGVTFWQYLQDRIGGLNVIPPLADLIRAKAAQPAGP